MTVDIILASSSPRRKELLELLAVRFKTHAVDIDETPKPGETGQALAHRLAEEKAMAGFKLFSSRGELTPVLGSDTVVQLDDQLLGKPENEAMAITMLESLSGKTHQVYTGVSLSTEQGVKTLVSINNVEFMTLTNEQITRYVSSGEPMDKAGAYAIQGKAGQFIKSMQGSFSAIMGLPLYETAQLLNAQGIDTL